MYNINIENKNLNTKIYMISPSFKEGQDDNNNKDLITFKKEIYEHIKDIEAKLTQMFENIYTEYKKQTKLTESKYETLTDSINIIHTKTALHDEVATKVEQLFHFKSTTENTLATLSIRDDLLSKDLKDAITKYDKIISDNLHHPELIGNDCKYKTLRDFIDFIMQYINEFISYKDKTTINLNTFQTKLDKTSKSISTRIDILTSALKQFTIQSINELDDKIEEKFTSYEDHLQKTRIENSKYTVQLRYQTANMLNEWDKVVNMKEDLIRIFEYSNNKIEDIIKALEQSLFEYNKQYKQIKNKFIIVSNILKDIKLGKDGLMRQDITQICNVLNKEDESNNSFNKILSNYKYANLSEQFKKKYIKGDNGNLNSMIISRNHFNNNSNDKIKTSTFKKGTMFNLIKKNNSSVNTNFVFNKESVNSEENVGQNENDIDKQKTEGFEDFYINNSFKEEIQTNMSNAIQPKLNKTINDDDNKHYLQKAKNNLLNETNAFQKFNHKENKNTELNNNNSNILSIVNKNTGNVIEVNQIVNNQKQNIKTKQTPPQSISNDLDKTKQKPRTRNGKSNLISYNTHQLPNISNINFSQVNNNNKSKSKSLIKTSSEPVIPVGNQISKGVSTNELTEYLREIQPHLPKESLDLFYLKTSDRLYQQPSKNYKPSKQKPINHNNSNNAMISAPIKAIFSKNMNQTQQEKVKRIQNNYYYNLMVNDSNNINADYTQRKHKTNSNNNQKVFAKLLNNQPKYMLNTNNNKLNENENIFIKDITK